MSIVTVFNSLFFRVVVCVLVACFFTGAYAHAQGVGLVAGGGGTSRPVRACNSDLHYFNQVSGWQATWPAQWETLVADGDDLDAAITRWALAPQALETTRTALLAGLEEGRAAPRAVVSRVYQQVRDLSRRLQERDASYFFQNAAGADEDRWNRQMDDVIAPAVAAFAAFLSETYLPASNPVPGLAGVKDGASCFAAAATRWTTLSMSPEEVEDAGERLLASTKRDLVASSDAGEDFQAIVARLRAGQASDETTAEELTAISLSAIARAEKRMGEAFLVGELDEVVVEAMPAHMQASAPAGFYRPRQNDRTAAYILNPSRPGERRLMAEAIAFHETLPGHHLFFAYPRERQSTDFNAGIMEGWAIYAEYLADEMGLYATDFDRQGMIAKHLWASSRLVVEPGLHLRGWSRDDAIDFMYKNTALSLAEIEVEVDRYLALPGQSLSYMLGADLMLRERACARAALGEAFDIKEFHDVILAPGARSLPALQRDIRAWLDERAPGAADSVAACKDAPAR